MEIFKTVTEAAQEVRSKGQRKAEDSSSTLRKLGDISRSVADTEEAPSQARRGIAVPAAPKRLEVATDEDLDRYFGPLASEPTDVAPAQPQSQGSIGGDIARSVGRGAVGLVGGIYELGNMATRGGLDTVTQSAFGTSGTQAFQNAQQALGRGESTELQAQRAELDQADGFVESFTTILSNPRLAGAMVFEMVPQLATVVGAARLAAVKTLGAATKAGMTAEAASAAAATNATRTVLGLNAALEGGSAGSDARATIMQMSEAELSQSPQYNKLLQTMSPEDARMRLANDASAVSAAIAGSISAISGKVTGAAGLEAGVATKSLTGEVGKRTALGVAKDIGKAALKEVPQESLEEGGSQFGKNVGVLASGAKPDQDVFEGVSQAAGAGGALGLLAGAGFGAAGNIRRSPESAATPQQTETADPAGTVTTNMVGVTGREFQDVLNSPQAPAYLAALYSSADENTRAKLQEVASTIGANLETLSQDQSVVDTGAQLIDVSPDFAAGFVDQVRQFNPQSNQAPDRDFQGRDPELNFNAVPNIDNAPELNEGIAQAQLRDAQTEQAINDRKQQVRAASRIQKKPDVEVDPATLSPGPTPAPVASGPDLATLRRGYERRLQNAMTMPPATRNIIARDSVAEMISRGFSPEIAEEVWAPIRMVGTASQDSERTQTVATAQQVAPAVEPQGVPNAPVSNQVPQNQSSQPRVQEAGQSVPAASTQTQQPVQPVVQEPVQSGQTQDSEAQPDAEQVSNEDRKKLILRLRAEQLRDDKRIQDKQFKDIIALLDNDKIDEARDSLNKAAKLTREEGEALNRRLNERSADEPKDLSGLEQFFLMGPPSPPGPAQTPTQGSFTPQVTESDVLAALTKAIEDRMDLERNRTEKERAERNKADVMEGAYSDEKASARIEEKFGAKFDIDAMPIREFYKNGELVGKLFQGKSKFGYEVMVPGLKPLEGSTDFVIKETEFSRSVAYFLKNGAEMRVVNEQQGGLPLTAQIDGFERRVAEIMSGSGLTEKPAKQKGKGKKVWNKEKGRFDDDTGGVMSNLAKSGAMGSEAIAEVRLKERASFAKAMAAQQAQRDRIKRMEQSVANLVAYAQPKLDQLAEVRAEMEELGYPRRQIDGVVGQAEAQLQEVLDESSQLTEIIETQKQEIPRILEEGRLRQDQGAVGIQEEGQTRFESGAEVIDLDTVEATPETQRRQNRDLFETDGMAAARSLVSDIESGKLSFIGALRALNAERAGNESIGRMDIVNAMAEKGYELKADFEYFSQLPVFQTTLRSYVRNPGSLAPSRAREVYLQSMDTAFRELATRPAELQAFKDSITETEMAAYNRWKTKRDNLRNRLKQHLAGQKGDQPTFFNSVENAYPNALFGPNGFTLKQMRNPSTIPQADRQALTDIVGDEFETTWLNDVVSVLQERPDLEQDVESMLTKDELIAVEKHRIKRANEAKKNAEIIAKSPAYSQLANLRNLTPELFNEYRAQIYAAQMNELASIMQAAWEQDQILAASREGNIDADEELDAHADQFFETDEEVSENADEAPSLESLEEDTDIDTDEGVNFDNVEDIAAAPAEDQPENIAEQINRFRFKQGRYSGAVSAYTINEHLKRITSKWARAPQFQVLENIEQLPEGVRLKAMARLEEGNAAGLFDADTGTTYIFSQYAKTIADAEFTFLHETYGHLGLRAYLGNRMDSFLQNQYNLNRKVRAEADRIKAEARENGLIMDDVEATEEALADMAARGEEAGTFRTIIARLMKFLRSIGMDGVANWMETKTAAELGYTLRQAKRAARGEIPSLDGAPTDVRFAVAKKAVEATVTKDGKIVGYTRLNPLTNNWTVFTGEDLASGTYDIRTVDNYEQASDLLKKTGGKLKVATESPGRMLEKQDSFIPIPKFWNASGTKRWARYAQINLQNQYLPVYEVERFLKSQGRESNVVNTLMLYEGRLKPLIDGFKNNYVLPIKESIVEIGKKGGAVEDVDMFLKARHAKERNKAIRLINPKNNAGSGMTDQRADELMAGFKAKPYFAELEAIGAKMDQMSRDKVAYLVQTGMITEEQAAELSKYEHYVSLKGNATEDLDGYDQVTLGGRSFNVRGKDIVRATGRGTEAVDVLENTFNSYLSSLVRGQKNLVNQAILDMVQNNPDPNFAVVNSIGQRRAVDTEKLYRDRALLKVLGDQPTEQSGRIFIENLAEAVNMNQMTVEQAKAEMVRRIQLAEARRDIEPREALAAIARVEERSIKEGVLSPNGYVTMVEDQGLINRSNVLVVKVGGKVVTIEFADQDGPNKFGTFVSAIHGVNRTEGSDVLNAIGTWQRFFGQLVTSWNPVWVAINGIRDYMQMVSIASADPKIGKELAGTMAKNWAPSLRAARQWATNGKMSPAWEKVYEEYRQSGAETFFLDRGGLEDEIASLKRAIEGPKGIYENTREKWGKVADFVEKFTMPMETAPRLAAFKALRDAGWSVEEAAVYAKNVTVNFNMKGASTLMRNLYVFFNPAVQGSYRLYQAYKRGDTGLDRFLPNKNFAQVAGAWMALGIVVNFIARAMDDSEDEEQTNYDKLPVYTRATNAVLWAGGPKIPIAYGWNAIYSVGHFMADSIFGKTPIEQTAGRIASVAVDAFSPLGSNVESSTTVGSIVQTITPTIAGPLARYWANESNFASPIRKGNNTFGGTVEPDAYMHFDSASPLSKGAMHWLNENTGGNRFKSGLIDINPAFVDSMIYGYFPGLISEAYKMASTGARLAAGEKIDKTVAESLPLVGRFVATVPQNYDRGAFDRAFKTASTRFAEVQSAEGAERERLLKLYPNVGAAKAALTSYDQAIRQIRERVKAMEASKASDEAKVAFKNQMKDLEKMYYKRGVDMAIKAGLRNEVFADSDDQTLLKKTGRMIREASQE